MGRSAASRTLCDMYCSKPAAMGATAGAWRLGATRGRGIGQSRAPDRAAQQRLVSRSHSR